MNPFVFVLTKLQGFLVRNGDLSLSLFHLRIWNLGRLYITWAVVFGGNVVYNRFQITDAKHCQRFPQIQISVWYLSDTNYAPEGLWRARGGEIRVVEPEVTDTLREGTDLWPTPSHVQGFFYSSARHQMLPRNFSLEFWSVAVDLPFTTALWRL